MERHDQNTQKAIRGANTLKSLTRAMKAANIAVPSKVAKIASSVSGTQIIRLIISLFASALIIAGTYFSFRGGEIVFGTGAMPYASLFFTVLGLVITWVLFFQIATGWKKVVLYGFEFVCLIYSGYTIQAYSGIGTLGSTAEQKIAAMYTLVSQSSETDAQAIWNDMASSKAQASGIADEEERRSGKGIIYGKANTFATQPLSAPDSLPTAPKAPVFKTLTEANQWLQAEKGKLDKYNSKLQGYVAGAKNNAKAAAEGLDATSGVKLSDDQKTNLAILISSLKGIATFPGHPAPVFGDALVLTQDDMKGSGVGGYIGYVVEGAVALLLLILMLTSAKDYDIDDLRRQCLIAVARKRLDDTELKYNEEGIDKVSPADINTILDKMESDPDFAKYIKGQTFEQVLAFMQGSADGLDSVSDSKWKIPQIQKYQQENPDAADYMDRIVKVAMNQWVKIYKLIPDYEKALAIAEDANLTARFLKVVESFATKFGAKPEEGRVMIAKLMPEEPTAQYLDTLHYLAENLSAKSLGELTRPMVSSLDESAATMLVKLGDTFGDVLKGWSAKETAAYGELMQSGLQSSPDLERMIVKVISTLGANGVIRIHAAYVDTKTKAADTGMLSKITLKAGAMSRIITATTAREDNQISTAIEEMFEVK